MSVDVVTTGGEIVPVTTKQVIRRGHNNTDIEVEVSRERYRWLRDKAWQLAIDAGIDAYPLDINKVSQYLHLPIALMQHNPKLVKALEIDDKTDAAFLPHGDHGGIILINMLYPYERRRFSICHEIGHYLLDNLDAEYNVAETEANMFAARLLMPMCIIQACDCVCAEEVAYLFGTSLKAATKRFRRYYTELLPRGRFCRLELERHVRDQCEAFAWAYNHNDACLEHIPALKQSLCGGGTVQEIKRTYKQLHGWQYGL